MEIARASDAVPMTILTGFLGAGKTTLLNRILNGDHGLKVAVLVNDFGSINIDAELVVGVEDNMISLANGCVCCQIRDDLIESVQELLDSEQEIEYILLEASGVADPAGIAITFADPGLRDRVRLDGITCVVDAEQLMSDDDDEGLGELKLRQIVFSDMVVLNKVDLVTSEEIDRIRGWIDSRVRRIRIVEAVQAEVPYEILLGVGRYDPERAAQAGRVHSAASFTTWSYETRDPLSLESVRETIKKLPGTVYRCKGFVHTVEEPDNRIVLQVVGRRGDAVLSEPWDGQEPMTRVVAIGAKDDFDGAALKSAFDACVVS
jgi:G3E family GTPase